MNHATVTTIAPLVLGMAMSGIAFGLLYFAVLRWTAILLASDGGWTSPLVLTIARIGSAVLFLGLAAKLGIFALLAAFVGFLAARAVAVRVVRRAG
jgi:hypothetical protein